MATFETQFSIFDRVVIDGNEKQNGIIALITEISIADRRISYRCEWFDVNSLQSGWFDEFRLSSVQ